MYFCEDFGELDKSTLSQLPAFRYDVDCPFHWKRATRREFEIDHPSLPEAVRLQKPHQSCRKKPADLSTIQVIICSCFAGLGQMLSVSSHLQLGLQHGQSSVRNLYTPAIWSRFASPRAEVHLAPSMSRPNLFAGD